jgi:probable F420-dependent oxidoreductase
VRPPRHPGVNPVLRRFAAIGGQDDPMKIRFAVSPGIGSPDAAHLDLIVANADEQRFDGLWFSDLPLMAATDPFLAVAYAAARSSRLKLGVNLVPFGYEPFVFARQVAQLDQLTGGRLLVTLVPGLDQAGERAALGITGAHRGRRLDATIPDLVTWWAGGEVSTTDGGEGLRLAVRPQQDPLEIWLGGTGPEAIRRVGQLADGWLGSLVAPARAGVIRTEIGQAAVAAGRSIDPEHFGLSIPYARDAEDLDGAAALRRSNNPELAQLVPVGRTGLRDLIGQLIDVGLSKFVLRPVAVTPSWPTELAWLADAVLDLQT